MREWRSKGFNAAASSSGRVCADYAAIADNPSGSDVGQAVAYAAHAAGTGQAAG
jgi:hypothetical protein